MNNWLRRILKMLGLLFGILVVLIHPVISSTINNFPKILLFDFLGNVRDDRKTFQ